MLIFVYSLLSVKVSYIVFCLFGLRNVLHFPKHEAGAMEVYSVAIRSNFIKWLSTNSNQLWVE
jgi:hypothetical protein